MMDFGVLEKLPRLPLGDVHLHEGAKVAVFTGNQAVIGKVGYIPAATRGNVTLGFRKSRIVRRNGRDTQNGRIALWEYREPYGKNKGFAVLETATEGGVSR